MAHSYHERVSDALGTIVPDSVVPKGDTRERLVHLREFGSGEKEKSDERAKEKGRAA